MVITDNLVDGMLIEEDVILEIVRPGTSRSLPPGEVGEIVVTKINSDYPMIRLGTGDLSKILVDLSPCGRTNFRIQGWMGRAEQSTKFKGIFITPTQVNKVLDSFKDISKVKLIINTKDFLDNGELLCETDSKDLYCSNVRPALLVLCDLNFLDSIFAIFSNLSFLILLL